MNEETNAQAYEPIATNVNLEYDDKLLRLHFGGPAFASLLLTPADATRLGLSLIQIAAKMPPPEPPMIVIPGRGGLPS